MIAAAAAACPVASPAAPPPLTVRFDARTGAWTGLLAANRNLIARPGADVDIAWDGGRLPDPGAWRLVSLDRRGGAVVIVRRAGEWEIRTRTRVAGLEVRRDAAIRWMGAQPAVVRGITLGVPGLRLSASPADRYLIPGNFPVARRLFRDLHPGSETPEQGWTRGDYGVAIVASDAARLSLIGAFTFQRDDARVSVVEQRDAVEIRHRFAVVARVEPGREITCGEQVLRLAHGGERAAEDALRRLANRPGSGPPADRPAHLRNCVLYEAHPWGRLETWGVPDAGNRLARLAALLPQYRDLGVTALWLLPVSWPPPWVYTLPDFDRIAPEVGDAAQLRDLVRRGHRLGIRTLMDLVVYGIKPDSPAVQRIPGSVWCVDAQGKREIVWGGSVLAADCSSAAWQAEIARVITHWQRTFGVDGARLDCTGWGQALNWANPDRANAATTLGGLQLNRVVRSAFRAGNHDAFTLPEGGRPLVFRNSDLVFDYPLYLAIRDMTVRTDRVRWVADLQDWLQWEAASYPRRALPGLVRFLENHDTVAAASFFGAGPSQALMAACCLMQGSPLIYQEQETGFAQDLARWNRLRREEPCFADGDADYRAVRCSTPGVFCFLRTGRQSAAVVAVNLTGSAVRCRLQWPAAAARRFPAASDAFTGTRLGARGAEATVTVPPYRPVVVMLRPAPARRPKAPDADVAPGWRIETAEGVLQDRFRDPHLATPPGVQATSLLPVLARAWDPLEGGLLDASTHASMAIRTPGARGSRIVFDPRRASRACIVDPTASGGQASIVVEPAAAIEAGDRAVEARPGGTAAGVTVDPQFVRMRAGRWTLWLARRHGGIPVALSADGTPGSLIAAGADLYTDWGLHERGRYVSCDGDTNPRLAVTEADGEVDVAFTGILRDRSWNGVQTCQTPSPPTRYRLTYRALRDGRLRITLGITPGRDLPAASAFAALHIPLPGCTGWTHNATSGRCGTAPGQRVFQTGPAPGAAELQFGGRRIAAATDGLDNLFLLDSTGSPSVFIALMDGKERDLRAGREASGAVTLRAIAP